MNVTLHWQLATTHTFSFPADAGRCTLGRSADCDIHIEHATISRRHIEFVQTADQLQLFNLKAANPVFVNDVPVPQFQPVRLRPGDKIKVGAILIQVAHDLDEAGAVDTVQCHNCSRLVARDHDYCPWCGMLIS